MFVKGGEKIMNTFKESKEFRIELGERIKTARIKKNLTQAQLGELLGKSDNVIANWEKGTNRPDADTIKKLCTLLDVSTNELLNWKKIRPADNMITLAAHRTDGYDTDLPEEAQEELNSYIEFLKMKYKKKD